jgi:hypothetical protein
MLAVSITPHAQNNFEKLKPYPKQRGYAKKLKMHAVSMTQHAQCRRCHRHRLHYACMHDRRTIRTALAAFKGNIYKKNVNTGFATVLLRVVQENEVKL